MGTLIKFPTPADPPDVVAAARRAEGIAPDYPCVVCSRLATCMRLCAVARAAWRHAKRKGA